MKLHLSRPDGSNQITSCGAGFVAINGKRYERSLVVDATHIDTDWPVAELAALEAEHLAALAAARPEVVLLGTGSRLQFPRPEVLRPLVEAGIGYEVMDTAAACRTYSVLIAEGRRVVAALIV